MKKIVILFFLMPLLFKSQNYLADITAVSKNMLSVNNYSLNLEYRLFVDDNFKQAFQERNMKIKRMNENLFVKYSNGMEALYNKNYEITLNSRDKVLHARKRKNNTLDMESAKTELVNLVIVTYDSLMRRYEKITVLEKSNALISYELLYKSNSNIEKTVVNINRSNMSLKEVTHYYKKTMRVKEMDNGKHKVAFQTFYKDYKKNCVVMETDFDEKKYIAVNSGKIKPVSKYLTYKLNINND